MGAARTQSEDRAQARAFGAYIRLLRENFYGQGRGKGLRQLAREAGIAHSVLSRGERGLQDLRQREYVERLAPHLSVRSSVLKRVATSITRDDLEYLRATDRSDPAMLRRNGASRLLWSRVTRELERLRAASPETLEALLAYIEFLATREQEGAAPARPRRE